MQRQAIKRTPMSAPRSTPTAQATRAKKGPEKITVAQYLLTRLFAFNAKRLISIEHTDLESLNGYAGGDRIAAAPDRDRHVLRRPIGGSESRPEAGLGNNHRRAARPRSGVPLEASRLVGP